jgi:hypothetical protein
MNMVNRRIFLRSVSGAAITLPLLDTSANGNSNETPLRFSAFSLKYGLFPGRFINGSHYLKNDIWQESQL